MKDFLDSGAMNFILGAVWALLGILSLVAGTGFLGFVQLLLGLSQVELGTARRLLSLKK